MEPGAEHGEFPRNGHAATLDLSILGDITLELENAADLGANLPGAFSSRENLQEVKQCTTSIWMKTAMV